MPTKTKTETKKQPRMPTKAQVNAIRELCREFGREVHAMLDANDSRANAAMPDANASGVRFGGGAMRASRKPLYHLVPLELMEAVARTRAHGDLKYEPGNWKQGDRAFFIDCLNHTIEHLYAAVDLEDLDGILEHLGHAATNIAFMLWALRRGIISRDDFEVAAVILEGRPDGRVLR